MKLFKNVIIASAILLAFSSCKDKVEPEVKTVGVEVTSKDVSKALDPDATYAKVEFSIDGMTCAMGCAKTIEKKMAKMDGVKSAKVDFDKRLAMVEFDEAKVTPKSLEEAVTDVAEIYKVKDVKIVEDFGGTTKKTCKADCKMECCTGDAKKDKEACMKDCKKACCSQEKKVE
ncbi:cation transporter [Winogradskyella sp.]|uniref:cation transporter n=1 Tax=Winogradskyella sp. TaxID=1883156 RepID=UPI0035116CCF